MTVRKEIERRRAVVDAADDGPAGESSQPKLALEEKIREHLGGFALVLELVLRLLGRHRDARPDRKPRLQPAVPRECPPPENGQPHELALVLAAVVLEHLELPLYLEPRPQGQKPLVKRDTGEAVARIQVLLELQRLRDRRVVCKPTIKSGDRPPGLPILLDVDHLARDPEGQRDNKNRYCEKDIEFIN